MAEQYTSTSPYYQTGYSQYFLDVMVNRPIPKVNDDLLFTINTTFQYRPDLLAYDLYSDAGLWWVFYQRNPFKSENHKIFTVVGESEIQSPGKIT